jgi:nucleoid-associated protein EbfC
MFDNMGDMAKMLSSIQEQAKKVETQLASKTYTVKSGAGMVEVVGNGKGEIIDLTIDDSLLEDKDSLQILLISAFNDLVKTIEQNKQQSAMSALGALNPFAEK